MENACKISVIVPVYNTAKYLKQCLDSLHAQTPVDMEFVLVDDGSTDDSGRILAEYAAVDSRFRVVTQENRGFAGARNRGLEEASGEFIGFVDSDDWIDSRMYSALWEEHLREPDADIIQCACIHEYPDENISLPAGNDAVRRRLKRSGGRFAGAESLLLDDGTIWNRIYRRSMLTANHIAFDPAMTFGEDVFFYWTSLISSRKIVAVPQMFYHYRRNRPGSQVFSRDRRIFAYFKTMEGICEFIRSREKTELMPWINHLKLSYLAWGFERLEPTLQQEYFDEFRDFLNRSGMHRKSPIGYPPPDGGIMYNLRYLVLRILHPLTLKAVLSGNIDAFRRIVAVRRFLASMPLRLARKRKKKG